MELLEGEDLPEFWCREDDEGLTLFLAHPKTRELSYPMAYGQSRCEETRVWRGKLYAFGRAADLEVTFAPYQSVLLRVGKDGSVTSEDMAYEPPAPLTGPSPS